MLIDTHAHLWFDDYSDDLDMVLERAKDAEVEKIIVPGTNIESSKKAIELARKYPGIIYAAVGVHPEELVGLKSSEHSPIVAQGSELGELATEKEVVAIGEIGMDASTEELKNCMKEQKELFREQCMLALEFDLPVIIHTRASFDDTWEVLSSLPKMPRGQFHCFSIDEIAMKTVLERGFYISFCGNITWSKRVAKLVSLVPNDRLLLETDSPLMVPRDKRGKALQWVAKSAESSEHSPIVAQGSELGDRNEPVNVKILAEKVADLRGANPLEIEEITTMNAKTLYRL